MKLAVLMTYSVCSRKNQETLEAKENGRIKPDFVTAFDNIPVIAPIQGVRFSVNGVRLVHRVTPMMV